MVSAAGSNTSGKSVHSFHHYNRGGIQSRKSVADALVFLAVILYTVPPAETAGPATLLAAIVGFVSTTNSRADESLLLPR